jgi:hypothetical protein
MTEAQDHRTEISDENSLRESKMLLRTALEAGAMCELIRPIAPVCVAALEETT